MPITWQNINAPSNDGAIRGLALAGQGITAAFDRLGNVVTDQQNANQMAADRVDEGNVLALKEALAGARTPQEVAALQGRLDQMRSGLSNKGRTAVLGAEDARTAAVMREITARNTFDDSLTAREQANRLAAITRPGAIAKAEADANNLPIEINLARDMLLNREKLQPITNATAVQTAQNASRAAKFAGDMAPALEGNARVKAALEADTLTVQQNATKNAIEDNGISAEVSKQAAAYHSAMLADRTKLGALASKRGYPVDPNGAPDILKMSSAQITQLNADAGLAGLRSTKDLFEGDTKAMNGFVQDVIKSGSFTPEALARNQARIQGAFNSTTTGVPIGDDAAKIARTTAMTDVIQMENDSRNRFAPNSPDALNTYDQLYKEIPGLVASDAQEDVRPLQKMLSRFATQGIEVAPGQYVTPSAQDIRAALLGYTPNFKGNFFNSTQAEDIEKSLKTMLKSGNVTELLQQAEQSRIQNRVRTVKNILAGNPAPAAPSKK